jgi:hypothetical protein
MRVPSDLSAGEGAKATTRALIRILGAESRTLPTARRIEKRDILFYIRLLFLFGLCYFHIVHGRDGRG